MRADELVIGETYAIKDDHQNIVQAIYCGKLKSPKTSSWGYSYLLPCFEAINDRGKKYKIWLPTAHRVKCLWSEYVGTPVTSVGNGEVLSKEEVIARGMREAVFQAQYQDIETLSLLLQTFEISSGVVVVKVQDDAGMDVAEEPALFIRHKDAQNMMQLARKMGLYAVTEDLLD